MGVSTGTAQEDKDTSFSGRGRRRHQVTSVVPDCVTNRRQPTRLLHPWDSPGTTLEWVAISFSSACMHAKSRQSCPPPRDPTDSSPPGSSVHRILQARILAWEGARQQESPNNSLGSATEETSLGV